MQRPAAVLVALGTLLLAFGCGSSGTAPPPAVAAPPQAEELAWNERTPETGPGLVFRVHRFAVTEHGWEADVEVENRSEIPWILGEDPVAVSQSFGLMRVATGELGEVEQRSDASDLPGLRPAQKFVPALAPRLAPDASWRGTISAPGKLAANRYVRVVFGPLVAVGRPPKGMPARFVWITDHTYRLRS